MSGTEQNEFILFDATGSVIIHTLTRAGSFRFLTKLTEVETAYKNWPS